MLPPVPAVGSGFLNTRDAGKGRGIGDSPSPPRDEVAAEPLAAYSSGGGGNELEFNMDAIDLSDMKVRDRLEHGKAVGKAAAAAKSKETFFSRPPPLLLCHWG